MHVCVALLIFLQAPAVLDIYTHAVLCGAIYHSTVKSSERYIRLFVIDCCLCVPKIIRFGQIV